MTQNKLTREYISAFLVRNDAVGMHSIGRALVLLNKRQTEAERSCESTLEHNLRGFTSSDAKLGTSMANFYAKRSYLTEKQIAYWLKPNAKGTPRIVKYWRQILEDAKAKQEAKAVAPASQDTLQKHLERLRVEYCDVVDSDSVELIKPVVDEIRAIEAQLGIKPYNIGGSVYN